MNIDERMVVQSRKYTFPKTVPKKIYEADIKINNDYTFDEDAPVLSVDVPVAATPAPYNEKERIAAMVLVKQQQDDLLVTKLRAFGITEIPASNFARSMLILKLEEDKQRRNVIMCE